MVEFGGKLSLKDNMYATLQKNLKKQQEFQKQIQKNNNMLKGMGKMVVKPVLAVKDKATEVIRGAYEGLKKLGSFVAKPMIAVKNGASAILSKIGGMLKTLAKGATIGLAIAGAGAGALMGNALSDGAMLEQQQISMEHFIGVNNGDATSEQIKAMTDEYMSMLRENANSTPFQTSEVMSAGARAINVSGGDTTQAQQLLKVAEDMASLNPEKSLSDAMEALADMKNGETERMKEFGFKISAEDIKKAGGTEAIINEQLAPYFEGGAMKLATSASGLVSTIKGKIGSSISDMGMAMIENAKPLLEKIITVIDKLAPKMEAMGGKIANGFGKGVGFISDLMDKAGGISPIFEKAGAIIRTVFDMGRERTALFKDMMIQAMPMVQGALDNVLEVLGYLTPVMSSIGATVASIFPVIASTIGNAFTLAMPFIKSFAGLIQSAMPVVGNIIKVFASVVDAVFPVVAKIFTEVSEKVGRVIEFIGSKMGFIQGVFDTVMPIITSVLSTAWDIISPIMDIMISIFEAVFSVIEYVFPSIQAIISDVWGILKPIFDGIATALTWVGEAVDSVIGWFGDVFSSIGSDPTATRVNNSNNSGGGGASRAMGVQRVPYDNYSINAHEGERLLTKQEANQLGSGSGGINIAKLADNIIIREEADIDRITTALVKKLKRTALVTV